MSVGQLATASHWMEVTRYYAMNYDKFEMPPHTHPEFEIMYAVQGKCKISCWDSGEAATEWNIREGEYLFLDSNIRHQLEVQKGSPCRILNLEIALKPSCRQSAFNLVISQSKSLQDFIALPSSVWRGTDENNQLYTIISELHKQLQSSIDQKEHSIGVNLLLTRFLLETARQKTRKYRVDRGNKYIRKASAYISEHFDRRLPVSEIAAETGITAAYLQRMFKEQTGKSLVHHINELRIKKAKILLETSTLSIVDTAISVGFHNRQHFSYTFTALSGCSPASYRKQQGGRSLQKREVPL